jgi:hypothetical protein
MGSWMGPSVGVDTVVKRKTSSPRRESKPRTPRILLIEMLDGNNFLNQNFVKESLMQSIEHEHVNIRKFLAKVTLQLSKNEACLSKLEKPKAEVSISFPLS